VETNTLDVTRVAAFGVVRSAPPGVGTWETGFRSPGSCGDLRLGLFAAFAQVAAAARCLPRLG
jgi:hypothetical protein